MSKKIRVLLCITELNIGGAERMLTELAIRMDKNCFEPVVYSLMPCPAVREDSCVPALEAAEVPVRFLNVTGVGSLPKAFLRLVRYVILDKPDIVQSFLFHANMLSRFLHPLFSWWLCPFHPRKILSGIRVAEKERRKRWMLSVDFLTQFLVSKYICVSQGTADFTRREVGIASSKLLVIPNGIDSLPYRAALPADLSGNEFMPDSKKILFIGRLHTQKGLDWFFATLPHWVDELPDWEVLIVGNGPEKEGLFAQIASLEETKACRPNAIRQKVHFLGWRSDIPELLAASDLLISPSRWEGMPNAVLQGMAAGLPVLATDVEGSGELLDDPMQLCPFGDTDRWTHQLLAMARSSELRKRLGTRNADRVTRCFTLERMVESYQEIWKSLLPESD